jgi:hypothetical protein
VVAGVAAVVARQLGGTAVAGSNLRNLGVPTSASEWGDIATLAGVACLVAMLVGALLGGALGERWHSKLVSRALDPQVGAEAEARRAAERRAAEAEERRIDSYRRVRTATPARTRRVDREAEDTRPIDSKPGGNENRPVRWRGRRANPGAADAESATDRQTARSAGRTG